MTTSTWRRVLVACVVAGALGIATTASAHKPSDSYLALRVAGPDVAGQWDIALRDLDYAVGLDADADGAITWGEVRGASAAITAYAFGHLAVAYGGERCLPRLTELLIDEHGDGAYAALRFAATGCASAAEDSAALTVTYDLLFDLDPLHRGLVRVTFTQPTELHASTGYDAERGTLDTLLAHGTEVAILSPDHPARTFAPRPAATSTVAASFVRDGVWHIWTGYDHLLFLLSLLLPAVARREPDGWWCAPSLRDALGHTVMVVTAFTVAHSITLSLAALAVVHVPARLVETLIAISVALAAANNLVPVVPHTRAWQLALGFGLIHGFGFASVLGDLELPRSALVLSLVSFNLGVELGQLAVVVALLPLAFLARRTPAFRFGVMSAGSAAVVLLALAWAGERALNLRIF